MKKSIAIVSTSPMIVRFFLLPLLNGLISANYKVTVIADQSNAQHHIDALPDQVTFKHVPIKRNINLIYDIYALFKLVILLSRGEYDIAYSLAPKAGLLSAIAGYISRVPVRIHVFTGQVWANMTGIKRRIFLLMDRLIYKLSTLVLIDSHTQKQYLIDNRVVGGEAVVINNGSICGVNGDKFSRSDKYRNEIRKLHNISKDDILVLYLGRLKKDKGVLDLIAAFNRASEYLGTIKLMLVGPDEGHITKNLSNQSNIYCVDYTPFPEKFMSASDIFCMPSYREGFGNAALEASACGLPVIATNIYGLSDVIVDGETGALVEVGDIDALSSAILNMAKNTKLRESMGNRGAARAREEFSQDSIVKETLSLFQGSLSA